MRKFLYPFTLSVVLLFQTCSDDCPPDGNSNSNSASRYFIHQRSSDKHCMVIESTASNIGGDVIAGPFIDRTVARNHMCALHRGAEPDANKGSCWTVPPGQCN